MLKKYFYTGVISLLSIVSVYNYINSDNFKPKQSEYQLLAMNVDDNSASDSFFLDQPNDPYESRSLLQKENRPLNRANLFAPAVNAVAIAKFMNGNLPTVTPNGNNGVPLLLSQTGAFSNLSTLSPIPGIIPYDMIEPFWSDGAKKSRWMAIPNDGTFNTPEEQIKYSQDYAWDFPRGAVLIKHFELGGKRLETRFEVKGDDDVYYYLSYKWNDAQTDATLLFDAVDEDVVVNGVSQSWHYPGRNECASCHYPQNGSVLGPKTRNLNKSIVYPSTGIAMNQLVNLSELGILNENITINNISNYPAVAAKNDASASLEERARAYIDVNCASCHNPTVENIANFDARYTTALENQNLIYGNVAYDEGLNDPKVIIPQDVSNSMAHFRMNSTQTGIEMPPLAKDVVDEAGVQLIAAWINSLTPVTTSPPVASFSASTTYGPAPLAVSFNASSSFDADQDNLSYAWNFGDGNTTTGITTNHTYSTTGSYTVTLTVNDGEFEDQSFTTIVVNNSNPGSNTVAFTDATSLLNQDNFSGLPMGVIDMNGDGKDDIVQFNSANYLRIQYQNSSSASFSTYNVGQVSSQKQWSTAIADYDQNGFNDVMSGGAYDQLKIINNNNGNNAYSTAILPSSNIFIQGSNFVDINNDGWADIFACHDDAESRAYVNNQNGTFSYDQNLISTKTNPSSDNSGNYASMWIDYDNDRDLDLYISKCRAGVTNSNDPRRINMLWRNDGNNNFTEVAAEANLKIRDQTWLSDFGDIDNDGDLDAIVINHGSGPNLMRNNGDGTFTEVTANSGLLPTLNPEGLHGIQGFFKDFNNDGYLDLMVSGDHHYIFFNNGDGTFKNAPNPFNSNTIQSFSVGDLNHDGALDIYAGYATGLNSPSRNKDRIWLNQGNSNNYLNIQLKGTQSNINAIGARVELYGAWGIQIRDVRSGEGYGLVNSYTQHFGIGASTQVDKVIVRWPSGNVDEISNPDINQFLQITENLPEPTCTDGIQNGDETGIDCGGSCSTVCPCEGVDIVSIDFENNSGNNWTNSGTALKGAFVVANPNAQSASGILTQVEDDHSAQGVNALFTATNTSVGVNDIDGGVSIATSPVYNIEEDSKLSIWYFFGQRDAGDDPGDFFNLEYSLNGGSTYTSLASYGDETVVANWTEANADIPQGSNLVIRVSAADGTADGDIVEAGIDDFVVTSICVDPIAVTSVDIDIESITLTQGNTQQLTATVSPADADNKSVRWTSSDNAIATVDNNGVVTAVSEGNATITVTTNDGDYKAQSVITVQRAVVLVTGVTLDNTELTLTEGESQTLTATILPVNADNKNVVWSSTDEAIVTVDTNGLVTAISTGEATITVTTNDGNFTANTVILVEEDTPPPSNVTILTAPNPADAILYVNFDSPDPLVITTLNIYDTNNNLVKTYSDPASILVDGENYRLLVNDIPVGTYTLEGVSSTGSYKTEIIILRDIINVTGITTVPTITIGNGLSIELTATITPSDATDTSVIWSSSNESIASVSQDGLVTGVSVGVATITATTNDGEFASNTIVTIDEDTLPPSNVTILTAPNPADAILYVNFNSPDPLVITTLNIYDTNNNLVKTYSDPASILVDGENYRLLVNDIPVGTYTLEGVSSTGSYKTEIIILRDIINVTGITTVPTITIGNGLSIELTATITPSDATDTSVIWSSSNESIASVSQDGLVTGVSVGVATITATTNDGEFASNTIVTIDEDTLPPSNVTILTAPNPADAILYVNFNSPDPLVITTLNIYDTNNNLVKTYSDPASILVDGENYRLLVNDIPVGTYTLEGVSSTGSYKTEIIILRDIINVTGITTAPTITIGNGLSIELTATITPSDATDTSVIWSSSNESIASVSQDGLVTGVSIGVATITATTNDGEFASNTIVTIDEDTLPPSNVTILTAPNPADAILYVNFDSPDPLVITTLNIYDTNNNLVKTYSDPASILVDGENYRLLVNDIPVGTYTLEGVSSTGSYTTEIIILRDVVAVTGVSLPSASQLIVGEQITLTATVLPSNATNTEVEWSTTDATIASVSTNGLVTGITEGEVTITATTNDGNFTATTTISVTNTGVDMLIAPNPATFVVYIYFDSIDPIEITTINMYDSTGRRVKTITDPSSILDGENYRVVISDLTSGIYIIEGVSTSGNYQEQLIIE